MLRKQPGPTCKDYKRVETLPESVTTLNTSAPSSYAPAVFHRHIVKPDTDEETRT